MNPWSQLDRSAVLGFLKGGASLDPDVVRERYLTFVSGARMGRTFLLIPLVGGVLAIIVGLPLSLLIIGLPILLVGVLFTAGAWFGRRRLAQNIRVVEAVYAEFAATLGAATGQ